MRIHRLDEVPFEKLMECFLEAFDGYFVKMPEDHDYYRERWKAAGVDYSWCFGISNGDKLAGFIIHAMGDKRKGLTAFNTGTGVIPAYRGRKLVNQIYQEAIPALKAGGIHRSQLEVISQNEKAIKAYERVGFKKEKHFICVKGAFSSSLDESFELRKVSPSEVPWSLFKDLELYSWDNQKSTLEAGIHDYYLVYHEDELIGYFIHRPNRGVIHQLECLDKSETGWKRVLSAIKSITPEMRMLNIDNRLTDKLAYLELFGVSPYVEQYEMAMSF
ncbi:MAG: GNAT family N-acetyltransferase [Bacteroidota bacterium]